MSGRPFCDIFYVFVEILFIYTRLNMTHVIVKQTLQIPLCILIYIYIYIYIYTYTYTYIYTYIYKQET